jgi:hypothetical protein
MFFRRAAFIAAAVTIAGSAFAQQQPQTPADPQQPKAQGEIPSNARPTQERDTSLPAGKDAGSRGGESRATGDRSQTTGTQK